MKIILDENNSFLEENELFIENLGVSSNEPIELTIDLLKKILVENKQIYLSYNEDIDIVALAHPYDY
jgi:hypothetical protein